MYFPGPDRYQVYESRQPPNRYEPEQYGYTYPPPSPQNPAPPPSYPSRDYYGMVQTDLTARLRVITPIDQGEELLDRLEQTGRVPSKDKFRRMACMTFICTGTCPYNDRCVFMHDFRIKTENVKVRTTKQLKASNIIKDTFYWPDMTRKDITRQLDPQGLPDANQRYIIPESFASAFSSFHNRGLYSVWNHFVEFCQNNNRIQAENKLMEMDTFFQVSDYLGNRHIFGTYRLKIFVHLSMTRERDSLELDLRKLDTSFGSGLTTRSSVPTTVALTPLSPHAASALVGPAPSSNYKYRAISTATGVQVVETASLLSDPVRPRATTLESIETAQSTGDVSFMSDLSGFGGQKPDLDDYYFGDLPEPSRAPANLRSISSDMRWEGEQGRSQWDQRQSFQRTDRPFGGGFSPSRPAAPPQLPMGFPQYRDQSAPAFSPPAQPFSPRASPGSYGSYLSPQARPFSPRSPRQQPLYAQPPQQLYGGYDRDAPAPYPSQSRYQPRAPSLAAQYAAQQESMPYQSAPAPAVVSPSPAGPAVSPGGRYLITPPEPLEAPMPPMAAPVQRLFAHSPATAAPSTMSAGGSYVITPPPPEPTMATTQDPYLQRWAPPAATVQTATGPGRPIEDPLEQDWSLVDDATTFANTRANFNLTLSATALPLPAPASASTAIASPKHTKTVMWADQADQTKLDDGASEATAASTSSISSDSGGDRDHGEGDPHGADEFDILAQAAELGGGADRDEWQFASSAFSPASVLAPATTTDLGAPQLSMSWLQDEEDFRVDLLGALEGEDGLDGPAEEDGATPSLLDALSATPPAPAFFHERSQGSHGQEPEEQQLDTTALPSWLSTPSPMTTSTPDMFRSLDLHLNLQGLGYDDGDGGDDAGVYQDSAELESFIYPTLSLSLSPVQDQHSDGSDHGSPGPSGANSPYSPHHEAWPEPGRELASSGRETLQEQGEGRFYSARSKRLPFKG